MSSVTRTPRRVHARISRAASIRVPTTVMSRDTAILNREPCKISSTGLSRFAVSVRSPLFDFPVYRDERRLIGIPDEAVCFFVRGRCTVMHVMSESTSLVKLFRSDRDQIASTQLCTLNAIPAGLGY